jgi:hypothetical protein
MEPVPVSARAECEPGLGEVGDRCDGFEIRLIEDQQPVETLCANGAYKPFGHAAHPRCANVNSRVSPY